MTKTFFISILILNCFVFSAFAQTETLRKKIEQIIAGKKADVGVSIYGFEKMDTLSINGNKHYPMQSVYKFHIALAVLNEVDKKKLTLDQKIFIRKSELLPNTHSPLRDKYPNGNVEIPLSEILGYTVSNSDNNGCDILLRLIGGTKIVENYIHSIGIEDISIKYTEEEMCKAWNLQFENWTTPLASVLLLQKFHERKMLSQISFDFLWKIMVEATSGKKRLKGNLPAGTIVGHKTGTSDTNEKGVTAAVNDIGIVTLPNAKNFAICVFVSNSKENNETNEKIIADIAKATWDYYTTRK